MPERSADKPASCAIGPDAFATAAIGGASAPPSRMARTIAAAICVMTALALVYATFARMDVVVTAQGRVIPSGRSKVVQPLEAGMVRDIRVRDGQTVRAGEVLVELDPTTTTADRDRLRREHWEALAHARRMGALLRGKDTMPAIAGLPADIALTQRALLVHAQAEHLARLAMLDAEVVRKRADAAGAAAALHQIRTSQPLVARRHAMREQLAHSGHLAESAVIDSRLEVIEQDKALALQRSHLMEAQAAVRAALQQRQQAVAEFAARAAAELAEATRREATARLELVKATQRREWQTLRAPIDGVVQQMSVTTVGGVVTPAQPVATIVPRDGELEVDAQLQNKDIGHVAAGQRVIAKVETFDFTRYGYIEGEVRWVGTDAVVDPKLGPVYPVRIRLASDATPLAVNGRTGAIAPGMNVTADIHVDSRRMISYLLSPLMRYSDEALRER
jgi:hemolysin D